MPDEKNSHLLQFPYAPAPGNPYNDEVRGVVVESAPSADAPPLSGTSKGEIRSPAPGHHRSTPSRGMHQLKTPRPPLRLVLRTKSASGVGSR